jgi:hypothetical protein
MPKLNNKQPATKEPVPDDVMAHFGTIFCLIEDKTALILIEMGCLSERNGGTTTSVRKQGLEDLAAQFKVRDRIEIDSTSFKGTKTWYVRLGIPPEGSTWLVWLYSH